MEFLKYAAIIILSLAAFIILGLSVGSGKPIRVLLINALMGVAAFTIVNLTAHFTGIRIPLNEWTLAGAGIYGIPAVCGLLILRLIM